MKNVSIKLLASLHMWMPLIWYLVSYGITAKGLQVSNTVRVFKFEGLKFHGLKR